MLPSGEPEGCGAAEVGTRFVEIGLFGACVIRGPSGTGGEVTGGEVTGAKQKALFAILATAPNGRATRTHLQQMLWGQTSYDGGQQSLRRALSDVKRALGDEVYNEVIAPTNAEIKLDMSKVKMLGQPGRGQFLEGLDIREPAYEAWRDQIRSNPDQIFSLYGPTHSSSEQAVLPAVSILPFRVVLGDETHATLGDYLAEQICRSLSRSRLIAVISHLSARNMASRSIALADVRDTLNVDYFLNGSIRAIGDRIILDADFVDARSGRILWTRNFSNTIGEFVAGDSGAEQDLVSAIGRAIASEAIQHTARRRVGDIEDHHLLMAGVAKLHQLRLASFVESRKIFEEAIQRAPQTAEVHAWLADWYVKSVFNGWSTNRNQDIQQARDATARALDIDPENAFCLTMEGTVFNTLSARPDLAVASFDHALVINPNEALCHLQKGVLHAFYDEADEAVDAVKTANRLSPSDPFGYFYNSMTATAYLSSERWEEALKYAERSLRHNDRHTSTLRAKIVALYKLGRIEAATETFELLKRRDPDFTIDNYAKHHPAASYRTGQHAIDALRAISQNGAGT
ncbi:MAG: hypothetical protein AAGF13_00705 [Pseudomonadota bacterium]